MFKILILAMTLSLSLPLKSFAGLGDLDLGNFEDITKGLKDAVDQLDKNLKNKDQNKKPVNNADKPPVAKPETAEEKQKRLEAQKKAEQEKKKKLEAKKKAEQEKKKKLDAQRKAEQEKQKKLQAQRAAEEAERQRIEAEQRAAEEAARQKFEAEVKTLKDAQIAKKNETNSKAIKVFAEDLMFSKSDAANARKTEIFNEIKNTPLYSVWDKSESYCKSLKFEDLLNGISENIEMSGFYQSKLRLIRDILIHNAEFINSKDTIEDNKTFLKNMGTDSDERFRYSDIISELKQKAKERDIKNVDLPWVLQDLIYSEPGQKEKEYFWLSGNYVFDQPDDKKLSMLNNSRVDLLFTKFDKDSDWSICDYHCLVGPKLFLNVDLDNEHRTLFLHDLNLSESGGWRTVNALKILRQNSYGSEDVIEFTPTWLHDDNFNLFDFLAPEKSRAFAKHYVNHQDWLVHVALAQALLHKNTDYQACWNEYNK